MDYIAQFRVKHFFLTYFLCVENHSMYIALASFRNVRWTIMHNFKYMY